LKDGKKQSHQREGTLIVCHITMGGIEYGRCKYFNGKLDNQQERS